MSIFLIYGPPGSGKKTRALENSGLDEMFGHSIVDCMDLESTMTVTRRDWLDKIDYHGNNIDTLVLSIWNVDQVPILWQRGLLTKLEDWSKRSLQVYFTARSLSKVDKALQSRCIMFRQESRFKETLSSSLHLTDYDCPLGDKSDTCDELLLQASNLWKNFLEGKADCDLYLKDLFLWGMTGTEIVYALLDVFSSPPFSYSLDQMSKIVQGANEIPLRKANWIHVMNWLICTKKIIH